MTNAELIAKIKAEIERRLKKYATDVTMPLEELGKVILELKGILSFLSTLESEKPIDIDFEQELYKHFGQVKDFTLGMRIGKYFYELGKQSGCSEKPMNQDEVVINGHKVEYDKDKDAITMEEIPNDLEEAAEAFAFKTLDEVILYGCTLSGRRACFIAGAKWRYQKDRGEFAKIKAKTWCEGFDACKEQMPLPEDTVLFNKGVEEGKRLMMEDAVEGTVYGNGDYTWVAGDIPSQFKYGDKVRIIVCKNED